ncbi:GspH/FimT family pseudopilin [Acaryochloris sp. IP29b_bin.148]|uniref:GspH/FimT family pseudopilin n=1 Tax=Acaryochloris sp. IP29b_bin.148 TaxID=2969218 RepID=UPI002603061F|nr:GspH/FimT family pseudopilin [Acaryochloris sp. IP29b_bin.148]
MRRNTLSFVFYNRLIRYQHTANLNAGMSLIEILVVVALTAMLAAFAAPAITFGTNPLRDTSNRMAANFKLARAKAMAKTAAYRIRPLSVGQVVIEHANNCNETTWTTASEFVTEDLTFDTPTEVISAQVDGSGVANTGWNVCFNSRGRANQTLELTFQDTNTNQQRTLEIFVGGNVDLSEIS